MCRTLVLFKVFLKLKDKTGIYKTTSCWVIKLAQVRRFLFLFFKFHQLFKKKHLILLLKLISDLYTLWIELKIIPLLIKIDDVNFTFSTRLKHNNISMCNINHCYILGDIADRTNVSTVCFILRSVNQFW